MVSHQKNVLPIETDSVEAARSAGLRYTTDHNPGYQRKRSGKKFIYLTSNGQLLKDRRELARIEALVIPPAWEGVWICQSPSGHLQATGRDSKGRKQYLYHRSWRMVRDQNKYARLIEFASRLPAIRRQVRKDMALPGLTKQKVLAAIVQLLEATLIRVGNEKYARHNNSFGLTTMRNRHAAISGQELRFEFKGKGGKQHVVCLRDGRLARIVRRCQELPGHELFQFLDDNKQLQSIDSGDVNEYLRKLAKQDFTAKDYRTWAGTVLAALALTEVQAFDNRTQAKGNIVSAIKKVASRLGNTPSICRKCYIHPAVIEAYLDGTILRTLKLPADQKTSIQGLQPHESAVLALLQQRLTRKVEERRKES
jgi:DNA topoisomerase-1